MGTTAIEPGKGSWRIEELENMDSLQASKISLALFAGTTMALAKQGRCVRMCNCDGRSTPDFGQIKQGCEQMIPEERRLKKNQESLESYNWYKAHHVCVRCRNASATDGFVTCPKCREAINAGHRFWYAALTPERKKKGQAKTKATRAKWREQGRCTRRGREREDPNLLTCEQCRRGDRERKCKR